jgi:hypothetical protein
MRTTYRSLLGAALALSLTACAASPREVALKVVTASDAVADELGATWELQVEKKIDECREQNLPTPEEREACLGIFAKTEEAMAAVTALVAAQTAVVIAAQCEVDPKLIAKEFKSKCVEGKEADWDALRDSVVSAWDALAPFVQAIKE